MELSVWKISAFNIPCTRYCLQATVPLHFLCNVTHHVTYRFLGKKRVHDSNFQRTVLEGYWELEEILADLGFPAKVHVWKIFV